MPLFTEAPVLVTQPLQVFLLKAILRHPPLLLQGCRLLLQVTLLLVQALAILR